MNGERAVLSAKQTVYHVAPSSEGAAAAGLKWQVEGREGRRMLHEPHRTQQEAIDSARHRAKEHMPAQVVVHARDGHVRSAYAYGIPPAASPDERGRRAGLRGGHRPRRRADAGRRRPGFAVALTAAASAGCAAWTDADSVTAAVHAELSAWRALALSTGGNVTAPPFRGIIPRARHDAATAVKGGPRFEVGRSRSGECRIGQTRRHYEARKLVSPTPADSPRSQGPARGSCVCGTAMRAPVERVDAAAFQQEFIERAARCTRVRQACSQPRAARVMDTPVGCRPAVEPAMEKGQSLCPRPPEHPVHRRPEAADIPCIPCIPRVRRAAKRPHEALPQ
ncbi:DUF2188 domain-containing protein [Streptomyces sp. NPDC056191]|uniref:DUF2188 domain-containing protein n=1 Tax=Streptomyces sp. NPDC056191 TaxID=3345742 RepID=UPI0035D8A840